MSLFMNSSCGQAERSTEIQFRKFKEHYNEGHYDSIYHLFSPGMQKALPLPKTVSFFQELKLQAGNIIRHGQPETQPSFDIYRTVFEKAEFAVNIASNGEGQIIGLMIKPIDEDSTGTIARNNTVLHLPFKEEWTIFWGGDTRKQNYHIDHPAQKYAFDMIITDPRGSSFKSSGTLNEDYFAFGKELLAPCDAEVVVVVDGIPDNNPGEMNTMYVPGNTVILETAKGEYLFFAHFKQNSIRVKKGQLVKQGELLGLCGNSGNSSEPHLHFHIQDREDINKAKGIKAYFEKVVVRGVIKNDYSPVKEDRVKPGH